MKPDTVEGFAPRCGAVTRAERASVSEALAAGLAFDIASLFVSNPYAVELLAVLLAGLAALRWRQRRLAWIALVSTVAANPVNLSATIACNVVIAAAFLLVSLRHLHRVPRWLFLVTAFALASVIVSIPFWNAGLTPEATFTQAGAVANYLLGPFLFIPAMYVGINELADAGYLARGMLSWLIAPTAVLLALARAVGAPVVDPTLNEYEYKLIAVYRLWNVDVTLTRTQVGIVLAALACAAFALLVAAFRGRWRFATGAALISVCVLMVLTGSVGSTIAMLLGLAAGLLVSAGKVRVSQYFRIGVVILVALVAGWRLLPPEVTEYVGARYEERFSQSGGMGASDREELWAMAAAYATEHPTGVGWSLQLEPLGIYPHNDYLLYAIAFGVLCGVLYAFVVGRIWWGLAISSRRDKDPCRLALGMAGLGATTVLLVNSMSDHLTANRWYFNVVWSVIWYCYFASQPGAPESSVARGFGYEGGGLRE